MKNQDRWNESKFVYNKKGKLIASRNPKEVSVSSRLGADLVANFYDRNLKKYAKGNLLDLGCGKVPLYIAYKDKINNCVCVDWENTSHKNEFIDKIVDLNNELPFDDNSFDTIILSDVLEHIQNPMLVWNEMNRILKEGGVLIMNVPFFYWIHERPFDYYRYTRYALEYFANQSNFMILKIEELGGALEIITDIISKISMRIPFVGKYMAIIVQWSNMTFLKFKIGRKVLKSTSNSFPLGYGLIAKK